MLKAKSLFKNYNIPGKKGENSLVRAVNGVDFTLREGQCYALVGESGSGKSALSQMLMGLIPPSSGDVLLNGKSLFSLRGRDAKARFTKIQMVLQDGKSALDPRFTVYDSISEPIRNLLDVSKERERKMVVELMQQMELPLSLLGRRVHELSGGQQKRVCIARAIAVSPQFLIFDEAVSGLDVIVRKNILELLKRLQKERGFAYLFITHDIDVALYIADQIMVMKEGRIIESIRYAGDYGCFTHPYSRLLLESLVPENTAIQA
ncbi:Nickel import ATP-binding protein NikE [bioreactor metagenome]|uniref:Nickel import ATP-binding protein NikE n=1 Tax=bioreactor metagenome TaxID=1076179 RepID=A0A644XP05_9ZZZZ